MAREKEKGNSIFKQGEPVFGLGTSQIASLGRIMPYKDAVELFKTCFNHNVNVIDTSDAYGSGDAEYLIGKVCEELNANPFIITKAGFPYSATPSWMSPLNQVLKKVKQKLNVKRDFSPGYIIPALEKSLKRLKRKNVGAFLLHELFEADIRNFDCWETLRQVKAAELARMTGVSSNDTAVVKEGIDSGSVEAVQATIQLGNKQSKIIAELCNAAGIPIIANEVLSPYRYGWYDFDRIMVEVKKVPGLEGINAVQLLLAVTYFEFNVSCILLGTRSRDHLVEDVNSIEFLGAIKQNFEILKRLIIDNRK